MTNASCWITECEKEQDWTMWALPMISLKLCLCLSQQFEANQRSLISPLLVCQSHLPYHTIAGGHRMCCASRPGELQSCCHIPHGESSLRVPHGLKPDACLPRSFMRHPRLWVPHSSVYCSHRFLHQWESPPVPWNHEQADYQLPLKLCSKTGTWNLLEMLNSKPYLRPTELVSILTRFLSDSLYVKMYKHTYSQDGTNNCEERNTRQNIFLYRGADFLTVMTEGTNKVDRRTEVNKDPISHILRL